MRRKPGRNFAYVNTFFVIQFPFIIFYKYNLELFTINNFQIIKFSNYTLILNIYKIL